MARTAGAVWRQSGGASPGHNNWMGGLPARLPGVKGTRWRGGEEESNGGRGGKRQEEALCGCGCAERGEQEIARYFERPDRG